MPVSCKLDEDELAPGLLVLVCLMDLFRSVHAHREHAGFALAGLWTPTHPEVAYI